MGREQTVANGWKADLRPPSVSMRRMVTPSMRLSTASPAEPPKASMKLTSPGRADRSIWSPASES